MLFQCIATCILFLSFFTNAQEQNQELDAQCKQVQAVVQQLPNGVDTLVFYHTVKQAHYNKVGYYWLLAGLADKKIENLTLRRSAFKYLIEKIDQLLGALSQSSKSDFSKDLARGFITTMQQLKHLRPESKEYIGLYYRNQCNNYPFNTYHFYRVTGKSYESLLSYYGHEEWLEDISAHIDLILNNKMKGEIELPSNEDDRFKITEHHYKLPRTIFKNWSLLHDQWHDIPHTLWKLCVYDKENSQAFLILPNSHNDSVEQVVVSTYLETYYYPEDFPNYNSGQAEKVVEYTKFLLNQVELVSENSSCYSHGSWDAKKLMRREIMKIYKEAISRIEVEIPAWLSN